MTDEADQAFIAAFPSGQYLGDAHCQQAMAELSRTWKGKNPAADALIARFHPLTMDDIKQARDLDICILQSIRGTLNRVHLVKKDGAGHANPPPDDYRCESCHTKGWLWKDFQVSKLDGAVAPIWLCPGRAKLSSRPTGLTDVEGAEPSRQKVGVREFDENPRLLKLSSDVLGLALTEVSQTGSLVPFAILETAQSDRLIQGFRTGRLEWGYEEARRAILAAPPEAKRYALAWLGYITRDGVRYEAVFVDGGERGEGRGVTLGQKYKQRLPDVKYEPIGNPTILGPQENLLTLSADPDAASKLRPVVTRLTADMAHNHGPRYDEALTYEIRKCGEIVLDLSQLDRPFSKELQKGPDMVHVVMGRFSWFTNIKPYDREVILARDTLVPMGEGRSFPGFNEDGLITIGYSHLEPEPGVDKTHLNLVVLWATMFKVTDKEAT